MKKNEYGVFELVLPPKDGQPAIAHNSKIKVGFHNPTMTCTVANPSHRYLFSYPTASVSTACPHGSSM